MQFQLVVCRLDLEHINDSYSSYPITVYSRLGMIHATEPTVQTITSQRVHIPDLSVISIMDHIMKDLIRPLAKLDHHYNTCRLCSTQQEHFSTISLQIFCIELNANKGQNHKYCKGRAHCDIQTFHSTYCYHCGLIITRKMYVVQLSVAFITSLSNSSKPQTY